MKCSGDYLLKIESRPYNGIVINQKQLEKLRNTVYIEVICSKCNDVLDVLEDDPYKYFELNKSVQKCIECGLVYAKVRRFKYARLPFKMSVQDREDEEYRFERKYLKDNTITPYEKKHKLRREKKPKARPELPTSQSSIDDFLNLAEV